MSPGFALYDPMSTEKATPRDLASHRTGVPDHWFLWYGADEVTRAELLSRLRYLEPNHRAPDDVRIQHPHVRRAGRDGSASGR